MTKGAAMTSQQEHDATIDAALAGGAITMPLWAAELNFWLHLFMAVLGSGLLLYRCYRAYKEATKPKMDGS
jgi:hypothetical protein